jgi:hypothetical protein
MRLISIFLSSLRSSFIAMFGTINMVLMLYNYSRAADVFINILPLLHYYIVSYHISKIDSDVLVPQYELEKSQGYF